MYTQPETPAALLIALTEALFTPAGMLLVVVLLLALLFGARRRPAPVYTVVTLEPTPEAGVGAAGCLPLLLLALVLLLVISSLQ
ncbi:MAG: hypothetical protein HGA45_10925 [Chloroflexales bacterium]|nr:hypothetical protein [Chloroflexales bacterium]